MTDIKALATTVKPYPTVEELKALPILFVLEKAGIAYEERDGSGVYVARNPFRIDENPSFDIFGAELERWGDFAEGSSGDVLDLLQRFQPELPFVQVKDWAARLLEESQGWDGPRTGGERKAFDLVAARRYVENVLACPREDAIANVWAWQALREDRLHDIPTDWLVDTFSLGYDGDYMTIPYFDAEGQVRAFKTRDLDGGPVTAVAGTGGPWPELLYGMWRDNGLDTVVLCEGESDVWSGTHAAGQGYVFLGLPTGAGTLPTQASYLAGRRVILAFDGDPAGRTATEKWTEALTAEGCTVLVGYVPDRQDLSKLSADECRLVLDAALPEREAPEEAPVAKENGYWRFINGKEVQASDWTFVPSEILVGDSGISWRGTLLPAGTLVTIRSFDLSSKSKAVEWSGHHGVHWFGSDRDAQLLSSLLSSQSTHLPRGKAVSVAGLHHEIIAYPGGRIGDANYVYVPGKSAVPLTVDLELSKAQPTFDHNAIVEALRTLHRSDVMDPILAWLAIAPLRSRLTQFPILAVTGGSGTGKTTLVREVVRHFTATAIGANLTGTTKFAMLGYLASTNAFPVWFDEYRPGARKDTVQEFNQLLRDAYTGQASIKGGMGDHWSSVSSIPVACPIIVSGEDSFSETSHTERMVLVHLPRDGKNPELMKRLIEAPITSLPAAYYDFVRTAATPVIIPEGPESLPDRQRYNLGVLRAGWRLLEDFCYGESDATLGEPNWSLVIEEGTESAASNPILDAIRWALEEPRLAQDRVVFIEGERAHVRVDALVAETNRAGVIQLPGGAKAVAKYLKSHLGGEESVTTVMRLGHEARIRTWSVPAGLVLS